MSMSRSRENCRVVLIVENRMPLGLMLERRICVSCFLDMEHRIKEVSEGAEGTGWDPNTEEAVVGWIITEECLAVDPVGQSVGWSGACRGLPGKKE